MLDLCGGMGSDEVVLEMLGVTSAVDLVSRNEFRCDCGGFEYG